MKLLAKLKKAIAEFNEQFWKGFKNTPIKASRENQVNEIEVVGKQAQKSLDGIQSTNATDVNSRTASNAAIEKAKDTKRRADKTIIGYLWVSVLDSKTSTTCMDLHGKRFYYNRTGPKLLPGLHENCRSTTVPIFKDQPLPEIESFVEWAKKPENQDDLREAMGETRYALFTKGKLKIYRFNDAFYKPLTLKQLRKQNEIGFKRIKK